MNAIISGQAGLAFVVSGNDAEIFDINGDDKFHPFPPMAIWHALENATDVRELRNTSYDDVLGHLRNDWARDRALHLTLILLDPEEDTEEREAAAMVANQMMASPEVCAFVRDRLYAAPMPAMADLQGGIGLTTRTGELLSGVLSEVREKQTRIQAVWTAFSRIPEATFGDSMARPRIEAKVKGTEAARLLVEAGSSLKGNEIIKLHQALSGIANGRAIANEWVRALGVSTRSKSRPVHAEEDDSHDRKQPRYTAPTSGYKAFVNVTNQKAAIKAAIARGDLSLVRKFVSELVAAQTSGGQDPSYASKSLCDLSQHAKAFHNYSLQLELAEMATDVCADDGWAHSQVADAFICLGQADNARRALERARELGERGYAATGTARLLRLQGNLAGALAAFEQAIREFSEEPHPWLGRAEVLREMWRLDDARAAYDDALHRFPNNLLMLCGRANVFKELGMFAEALREYDIVLQLANDEPYGRDGKADVLFRWGRLEDALKQYMSNIDIFPSDSVAHCGAAETLLALGRERDAIDMYNRAVSAFPHISVPASGRANALLAVGQVKESEKAYREAASRFPNDVAIRNGFANLLKRRGRFEEALQQYDRIAQDYPFDIVSRTARADLLKHLGKVEDAISAYSELLDRNVRSHRIRNSLAAVLVSNNELVKAEALLSTREPNSQDEWVGYHVRGMLFMKRRRFAEAERLFRHGINECPWHEEIPYFRNALSACLLWQNRLRPAERLAEADRNPISYVLKIHMYGELGKARMASNSYLRVKDYCPPLLVPVRNELAGRYVLGLGPRKPDEWILEQMTNAVLLRAA